MRQHRSITLLVMGLLLLGLAGCASNSQTSSSVPPSTSQTKGEPSQPPSGTISSSTDEPGHAAQGDLPAGEVQERAVTRPGPLGQTGTLQNFLYTGPTENITKVANAFSMRNKSLSQLITFNPGLVLTQPVTISILLGGYASQRLTQAYNPSTGNSFAHNDLEGDGKPRNAFATITFTEPNPAGGVYTYSIPITVTLDPLYNVSRSALSFTLFSPCDTALSSFGLTTPIEYNSDMNILWITPDRNERKNFKFTTRAGKTTVISAFAWARTEVSAAANLNTNPDIHFYEYEKGLTHYGYSFLDPQNVGLVNLVPGVTRQVVTTLKDIGNNCEASVQYNMTYILRTF